MHPATARGKEPTVPAEHDIFPLTSQMTREDLQRRRNPGEYELEVPEPNMPIIPDRGEAPAVGAERHTPNPGIVAAQRAHLLTLFSFEGGCVPDSDGPVVTRRHDPVAVWAEGNAKDPVAVSAQGEGLPTGLQVPEFHVAIEFASGYQAPAVRAERYTPDPPDVAAQG